MARANEKTRFSSAKGQPLALVGMRVNGTLHHDFAVVEMTQTYRNAEAVNIEATYTFPLPFEATLLHLAVRLDDKQLLGRVVERRQGEREYEDAIDAGNTAVMLEEVERGLYTMNVGNLMADEQAEVTMRFALPLKWEGQQMRLALPTTVAPRYGNTAEAGVQPHQVPAPDALADHHYTLALRVLGNLARAEVASPSHAITVKAVKQGLELGFQYGRAAADRDFVLTLARLAEQASTLLIVPDGSASGGSASGRPTYVAHVAFRIPERKARQPILLRVLVDCSGSMAGDSMALARRGALHAMHRIEPGDLYSVSAFGSTVVHAPPALSGLMPAASGAPLAASQDFVRHLDANLGGTEMLQALQAVFGLRRRADGVTAEGGEVSADDIPAEGGDVLLITDGETWDRVPIVRACRESGHRVFVIGIGASPNEPAVREIAQATGGAAAFVSPNEDIASVVDGHLRRMRVARVVDAQFQLPGQAQASGLAHGQRLWCSPERLTRATFPGDTLHVFCGLGARFEGAATLSLRYADGGTETISAAATADATTDDDGVNPHDPHGCDGIADADWPRIAAAARIRAALFEPSEQADVKRDGELAALAVLYQVISPFTNYLFVQQRGEDAASTPPQLQQVPNMLAAGWGGSGTVVRRQKAYFETRVTEYCTGSALQWDDDASAAVGPAFGIDLSKMDSGLAPTLLRRNGPDSEPSPARLIAALNPTFTMFDSEKRLARTLADPNGLVGIAIPIAGEVVDGLRELMTRGWAEEDVLIAFWLAMLSSPVGPLFSRAHRRGILRAAHETPVAAELVQWIERTMAGIEAQRWSWLPPDTMPECAANRV